MESYMNAVFSVDALAYVILLLTIVWSIATLAADAAKIHAEFPHETRLVAWIVSMSEAVERWFAPKPGLAGVVAFGLGFWLGTTPACAAASMCVAIFAVNRLSPSPRFPNVS